MVVCVDVESQEFRGESRPTVMSSAGREIHRQMIGEKMNDDRTKCRRKSKPKPGWQVQAARTKGTFATAQDGRELEEVAD